MKRERWTEADVDSLPPGEHDYFERKSGQLFTNTGELLGKLAKTISAMANSGGGHIILGVDDAGTPDGVLPLQGSTPVRDWLEQKVPNLVAYPLADFRVHVVERNAQSRIPEERQVLVIDVGDSAMAPHQCAHTGGGSTRYMYYYRQAGRSEPAPHFHLELLRQRLVAPTLQESLEALIPAKAREIDGVIFLATRLQFHIRNTGRVAAYKWQLQIMEKSGHPASRSGDYRFARSDYPPGFGMPSGVRLDETILPGCLLCEEKDLGLFLRPSIGTEQQIRDEIEALLVPLVLGVRLATEVSPGQLRHAALRSFVDVQRLCRFVTKSVKEASA